MMEDKYLQYDTTSLSAEKLELLAYLLEEEGIEFSPTSAIAPRASTDKLPLSFAQQRLWFLDRLEPGTPVYNIPAALRLTGLLNVPALEQSFNEIIKRHEVLRTTFAVVDEQPIQVIAPEQSITLSVIDLKELPVAEREAEAQRLANAEAQRPFDLASGPLLRSTLLQLDETEHILLFTMHHIASDAWSMDVLVREVAVLYDCFCSGKPSPLPELPIQYADYAIWQRQWLQGVLETQLDYWKHQLGGNLPVLELPADRPRPNVQTYQGATQSFHLSSELTAALKTLSQQEGSTLFMALLAAFKTLLHRYVGTGDIVVGSPIANRNRSEIEGLIGFFVNTLVLRTDLSDNPTFRELLGRIQEVTLGAYAHQDLPFDLLVEELRPQRELSHTPLFQVTFALQHTPMSAVELSGLTLQPLENDSGTAKFDLSLLMEETETKLQGSFVYNTDLFDAATITRMAEHFQTLLVGIVANPEQRVAELPLLTTTEQYQLLVEWNHTQVEYPLDQSIYQLFEAQVERTPDAIAVVFADQQLTYQELNARANKLAHYLQALGVAPDVLVGICMERSLEMVVGMLGTLKAGGAYVPLEPTYPQERLVFMIEDACVSVLLTQERLVDLLPKRQAQIVCLDRDWEAIAQESDRNPTSKVSSDHLAYAIYTSGSTGKPKGVAIPHRAICNHMFWMQAEFPLTQSDCVLQKTPFSFDASVWEFYAPLLAGGRLILAQPGGHQDSAYLLKLIAQQQVTILQLVPSGLRMLLEEKMLDTCKSLRRVFCGGESLSIELQERFFSCLPDVELHNLYGPTEATIDTTFWICQPGDKQRTVPIGRAIANAQIFVLDSYLQPVPIGVPGEIYIGGEGLARGYLNQPNLTAEKFIPNPFNNFGLPSRLYKTGDLARYRQDGKIEFLGRIDHQVKIRGFRIEQEEIEALLSQHPNVRETVVQVREDFPGEKRLVAYVVPQEQSPTVSELRSFLKQNLPEYMVPSVFLLLNALPLTPNGKVDRKSLPAPDTGRPELEGVFVPPGTAIEETLVKIWSQVLRVEKIGVHDNFFQLGGDSILSLQVIAKANQAGLQLTPKQLFEHQTIAELAAVSGTTTLFAAEQGIVTGFLPLTPIQHWFFEQALPDSHHWNQSVMLEVHQPCDPLLLEQIVQQLLAHHDALRLRFVPDTAGWQAINAAPDEATPFSVVDLSVLPKSEQTQAIEEIAAALQTSLNLSAGPLVRVALFELGAKQPNRLLIVIHHLVVDGVSWRILLEDLQTVYQQLSQGKTVQLPPKTTSYKQWAKQLTQYAQSDAARSQIDYWLSKSCQQSLPVDFPGGENTVASACTMSVALSQEETKFLIQEVPVAYQTQINDVLLTALVQAFRQWTGESSLLVDLEGHGREEIGENVDLSRTVGWFTTIFPVLLNLGEASDPGDALKTVKEQLRSIPDRGIGYGVLRYLSEESIIQQLQALPQAEVKFNYLGQFDQVLSDSSLFRPASESCGSTQSQRGSRNCLLEVNGIIVGGQLRLDWTYSKALHQQATIEKLAQGFVEVLRSLIAHCLSPTAGGYTPSDFPQMQFSQTELEQLMAELGEFAGN